MSQRSIRNDASGKPMQIWIQVGSRIFGIYGKARQHKAILSSNPGQNCPRHCPRLADAMELWLWD